MDSSKVFGGAEESHSSESGWTMYIGDDGDDGDHAAAAADGSGNESDDSMASDASSGPSHQYGTGEVHDHFKPTKKKEDEDGTGSDKKAKRRMEKQKAEMKREEKDHQEMMFMPKRVSTAPAQSDSKVRKNVWNMTKRK